MSERKYEVKIDNIQNISDTDNYLIYKQYLNNIIWAVKNCQTTKEKQYALYFLCKMAKVWGVSWEDLVSIVYDIESTESKAGCKLDIYQIKSALKGYSDNRRISNKKLYEVTGIDLYCAEEGAFTKKDCTKLFHKLIKDEMEEKRIELLRRLVRKKKKLTVKQVLDFFAKHDVGISRSKFYSVPVYRIIMTEGVKTRKQNGRLRFSS